MKKNDLIAIYINRFPEATRQQLTLLLETILTIAPFAEKGISYGMPAFKYKGPLVYFAGYNNHIGFYPTASGVAAFQDQLGRFKHSKGAIQFPVHQPLPLDLIKRIVVYRIQENEKKALLKQDRKRKDNV